VPSTALLVLLLRLLSLLLPLLVVLVLVKVHSLGERRRVAFETVEKGSGVV